MNEEWSEWPRESDKAIESGWSTEPGKEEGSILAVQALSPFPRPPSPRHPSGGFFRYVNSKGARGTHVHSFLLR